MDTEYFNDKKPILIFVFILNALIMSVMGVVVWNENLNIAERIVDLCWIVFVVNLVVCAIYILLILLFIIKTLSFGGGWFYNKLTPDSENYEIPKRNQHEEVGNGEKLKLFDFFKDSENMNKVFKMLLLFSGIFLAIFIFTKIWYIRN